VSDNVTVAVVAACGVVLAAVMVLGGAVFAFMANNKRLDRIEHTLEVIQGDMTRWSEQIFKIKAHVKLD
jgi:type VI protein secretion system component VasK